MKKLLLATMATCLGLSAFGQGGIIIENGNNSSAHWNSSSSTGPAAPLGNTEVQLLWYNGTSFQIIGSVLTITTANGGTFEYSPSDERTYFASTAATQIPTYQAIGTFEVYGWTGNYASYAAAIAAGQYVGATASLTAGEANLGTTPAGTPAGLANGGSQIHSTWNGDLVLGVPEPSTIALGGLGAAALWLFRRRK